MKFAPQRGRSRFFSNTVALVIQTIVATLLTLAQVKILSNFLDQSVFGLFASLRGFSLLLAMLAANGLPQLLVRFVPEHESRGDRRSAASLSAICFGVSTLLLVLLCVLAYALRPWVLSYLGSDALSHGLIGWFAVSTLAVMLKQVLYGGLNGLRRLTIQVVIELASLAAVLVWIAIARQHLTLPLLFKILGTVHGLSIVAGLPVYFSLLKKTGEAKTDADGSPRYGSYMLWATGISLVAVAFTDVDRYLLAQVLSLELLALFHIGARVARLGHRLLGVANLAFQPEVTRIFAEGRQSEIGNATRLFMKFNVAVSMVIVAGLVLFANEIIIVVTSRAYLAAVPLMLILTASLPITTLTAPITSVMKALDQVRAALLADLAWAVTYIGMIFALGPSYGLKGIGMAALFASAVQLVVALRSSQLAIGVDLVARALAKLALSASLAWTPVYVSGLLVSGAVAEPLVKILLFIIGLVLYQRMLRITAFFDESEKSTLGSILRARGLGLCTRIF
jgi:O-antigen/teichoic acid export membrane protein